MPMVRISTNVPESQIPEDFEIQFTHVLSKSTGKPVNRIGVELTAGARLVHGGTREPATMITIKSIGAVSAEDNIRHTNELTKFFMEKLGLAQDKVIIDFVDLLPIHVGFNGTTVDAANKSNL